MRKEKKLTKNNPKIKKAVTKTIDLLEIDPFYPSLKSHKVNTRDGKKFSSRVTGDIRIIWDFENGEAHVYV